jgi:ABC-2 type transport system permease protein
VQTILETAVAEHAATIRAGRFAADVTGGSITDATALAGTLSPEMPRITVVTGGEEGDTNLGQFDMGAVNNLVMFVFLTATTSSAALIQARQLGVSRRMFSTPTSAATIIGGETLGRYFVTLFQGLFIIGAAALLFGVTWGNPLGAILIIATFSLVGTGAGMLIGTTFSNAEQAAGLSVFFSLLLAAIGGAMVPLEIFSDTMLKVAHVTPHAWAIDGFSELIRYGETAAAIAREIAILLAMGVVLVALSAWQFRRVLTR